MHPCQTKIQSASKLFYELLYTTINDMKVDLIDCTLRVIFHNGIILYITYNNHEEYSYQIMYTENKLDRERFDNYDKHWNVETKPHHFHVKGENQVTQSPMSGNWEKDIPILVEFLLKRLNL